MAKSIFIRLCTTRQGLPKSLCSAQAQGYFRDYPTRQVRRHELIEQRLPEPINSQRIIIETHSEHIAAYTSEVRTGTVALHAAVSSFAARYETLRFGIADILSSWNCHHSLFHPLQRSCGPFAGANRTAGWMRCGNDVELCARFALRLDTMSNLVEIWDAD